MGDPGCGTIWRKLMRKKQCVAPSKSKTSMKRNLSTLDLTLLGIGSTIGIGMYVLSGVIAKTDAGPAVVLSFFIAACASILSGLCYAEFAARVPSAGAAYAYSYATIGEVVAFIVGWNLLIEYAIGVASVGRAYTVVADTIFGRTMIPAFKKCCSMNVPFLASYFDFFGMCAVGVVTVLLAFGAKESSILNNVFTILNIAVVLFVLFVGSIFAHAQNWNLSKADIIAENPNISPSSVGEGGFAPFGFQGILKGSASCFYAYVGFDSIAASAEEARTPQKSIPRAIIVSLFLVFLAYFSTSLIVTMMVPYYLQDSEAPLAEAFSIAGFPPGHWVVTIGALCGHSSSLISSIYPMPRVIYSMASDGVIFKFLSKIHPKYRTPMVATFISGALAGVISGTFDLKELIDMMSIGTLTAYTIVAICVLCLRYRGREDDNKLTVNEESPTRIPERFGQIFNRTRLQTPTKMSSQYTDTVILLYCIVTILFCATAVFGADELWNLNVYIIALLSILGATMLFLLASLSFQPNDDAVLAFKVPFVPWIPGVSVMINVLLMLKLSGATWIRFGIWMLLGFVIYISCLCNGTTDKSYKEYLVAKSTEISTGTGLPEKRITSDDDDTSLSLGASTISDFEDINVRERSSGMNKVL